MKVVKKIKGKKLDSLVSTAFKTHCAGLTFSIWDLGKMSLLAKTAYENAATHEEGVTAADTAMAEACKKFSVDTKSPEFDAGCTLAVA